MHKCFIAILWQSDNSESFIVLMFPYFRQIAKESLKKFDIIRKQKCLFTYDFVLVTSAITFVEKHLQTF